MLRKRQHLDGLRRSKQYVHLLFTGIRSIAKAVFHARIAHISIQIDLGADLYSRLEVFNQTPLGILVHRTWPNINAIKLLVSAVDCSRFYGQDLVVPRSTHNSEVLAMLIAAGARDNTNNLNDSSGIFAESWLTSPRSMALLLTHFCYSREMIFDALDTYSWTSFKTDTLRGLLHSFQQQTRRRWSVFTINNK